MGEKEGWWREVTDPVQMMSGGKRRQMLHVNQYIMNLCASENTHCWRFTSKIRTKLQKTWVLRNHPQNKHNCKYASNIKYNFHQEKKMVDICHFLMSH